MNSGAKTTLGIAAALVAAAIFPLLGLLVGVFLAGMAVHSALSQPNVDKYRVGNTITPEDLLEHLDERNNEARTTRRTRRAIQRHDR